MADEAAKMAAYRDWCAKDGVSQLQKSAVFPPRHHYHVTTSEQPLHRSHQRPVNRTPAGKEPAPYSLKTDHMAQYYPPASTVPTRRNPDKFDALGRTGGWAPHTSNAPGAQRAVYDPVSHKSTIYTFDEKGGVSWVEGNGDKLLREKAAADAKVSNVQWKGRRKGVVEFVDRTHPSAGNQNDEYLKWCAKNDTNNKHIYNSSYHTQTGELTKWMDNAFLSKMVVPFYGKRPYEMGK